MNKNIWICIILLIIGCKAERPKPITGTKWIITKAEVYQPIGTPVYQLIVPYKDAPNVVGQYFVLSDNISNDIYNSQDRSVGYWRVDTYSYLLFINGNLVNPNHCETVTLNITFDDESYRFYGYFDTFNMVDPKFMYVIGTTTTNRQNGFYKEYKLVLERRQ